MVAMATRGRAPTMFLWLLLLVFTTSVAVEVSKSSEGYSAGFLADCPGSNKDAYITQKTLKKLAILLWKSTDSSVHTRYNYYQMDSLLKDPDFDLRKQTMMFAGGYISSPLFPFAADLGRAYKRLGYNVLMLDTLTFTNMEYPHAARLVRPVGKHIAEMLVELTQGGLDIQNLELIGMSLGGQTISFIAKHYKSLTGVSISKAIALEPAGPCFRNLGPEDRMDKSDADFVIHVASNIDGYGMATPVGHVNFYVNGGEFQPGGMLWFFCPEICSHTRSLEVWMSSLIYPDGFIAIQCDSVQQARNKDCFDRVPRVTNVLGPKTDRTKEGIFYLSTSNTQPFYMGKKGLKKESDYFLTIAKEFNNNDTLKI